MANFNDQQIDELLNALWPKFEERITAKFNSLQTGTDPSGQTQNLTAGTQQQTLSGTQPVPPPPANTPSPATVDTKQTQEPKTETPDQNNPNPNESGQANDPAAQALVQQYISAMNQQEQQKQKAKRDQQITQGLNMVTGVMEGIIAKNNKPAKSSDEFAAQQRAAGRQIAGQFGPWGAAAAAASGVIEATGGYTHASTTGDSEQDALNKIGSMALPGAGYFAGKTHEYKMSDEIKEAQGSYSGSFNKAQRAEENAGQKMLARKAANSLIDTSKEEDAAIQGIVQDSKEQRLAQASNYDATLYQNQLALQGGIDTALLRAAKQGGVLEPFEDLLIPFNFDINSIMKFQDGGQMSIIPEGALHAHRHHMEDDEHITKKGIPVVDNDGKQQAEIERNEWVWNYDLSKKVEELWQNYKDAKEKGGHYNKFAIEAGKMIVSDLFKNTDDRTGLIKETK